LKVSEFLKSKYRTYLELTTIGNIDGVTYQNSALLSTEIQIDNAQRGLDVMLIANVMASVCFIVFIFYHIFASRYEMRSLRNVTKGKAYHIIEDAPSPLSVKEFAVIITNVQKGYKGNISDDLKELFGKYGNDRYGY
jgi:hypothetical protein